MGDTITRIQDDTGGSARGVQGEYSLDGDVHGGGVEGLEHDLGHLLPVGLGVQGSLSEHSRVLLRGNSELVVEGVMPDLLHIVPVGDDSVLDGVLQSKDTPLALGLISDVGVLLSHANHDTLMPGSANNGGEDGSGSVISGKTGLNHTCGERRVLKRWFVRNTGSDSDFRHDLTDRQTNLPEPLSTTRAVTSSSMV